MNLYDRRKEKAPERLRGFVKSESDLPELGSDRIGIGLCYEIRPVNGLDSDVGAGRTKIVAIQSPAILQREPFAEIANCDELLDFLHSVKVNHFNLHKIRHVKDSISNLVTLTY